ncbi:unnamed protein product [Anisakis simplex]|uniref:Uncharacterized protein n=1 Tax=Anisakis simplex TaxID=6269 RepID=A0A0M3JIX4_ANISI|nr:unnamed protein product [Anisakis simplex]
MELQPDSRETGLNYRSVQSYARYENQQQPPCDIHSTRATLSPAATANDSQVQPRLVMPDYGTLDSARSHMSRPRSFSPVKTPRTPSDTLQKKSRSKLV